MQAASSLLFQNALERRVKVKSVHFVLSDAPTLLHRFELFASADRGPREKASKHREQLTSRQGRQAATMAFGNKKEGLYLRPRVRRTTPLMDIAFAIIIGGASGVYIFNDSMRRWQQSELELAEGNVSSSSRAPSNTVVSTPTESSH